MSQVLPRPTPPHRYRPRTGAYCVPNGCGAQQVPPHTRIRLVRRDETHAYPIQMLHRCELCLVSAESAPGHLARIECHAGTSDRQARRDSGNNRVRPGWPAHRVPDGPAVDDVANRELGQLPRERARYVGHRDDLRRHVARRGVRRGWCRGSASRNASSSATPGRSRTNSTMRTSPCQSWPMARPRGSPASPRRPRRSPPCRCARRPDSTPRPNARR